MKVVVDTNVFVSAVFFGGVPGQILGMWRSGDVNLTMTEEILLEYVDVLSGWQDGILASTRIRS